MTYEEVDGNPKKKDGSLTRLSATIARRVSSKDSVPDNTPLFNGVSSSNIAAEAPGEEAEEAKRNSLLRVTALGVQKKDPDAEFRRDATRSSTRTSAIKTFQ